ncbi:MAG: hypothetical protein RLY21_930 [Planctomycetota bacterium]|jgi:hypothetical protein
MSSRRQLCAALAGLVSLSLGLPALAVDLSVSAIEVTQGYQTSTNSNALVARNATVVRARISLNGQTTAQPGVDAVLRIYSNGIEIPSSPVYSTNGPITAPVTPNTATIDHTINFLCVPPQSTDIDFVVTVNPFRTLEETNYANNSLSVTNKPFVCRKFMDIAYVAVNYTPGGGLPNAATIEPGTGDSFLRGIYKTGDWNYHRSPLPGLTWTTDINSSNNALLTALNDIRQNQIPAAGYARPEFIYGWLPGNPFSGNGQAIGIPGAAAFGNTENSRFQRTFAHEIGHCWGQQHNTQSIAVVGFDTEHLLRDPLNIAQVMPTTKKDIMYAGLLTVEAWVASISYNDAISDARSACTAFDGNGDGDGDGGDGDGGDEGASDAATDPNATTVLRVAGVHDHVAGTVTLLPCAHHELIAPTEDNPRGNVAVESYSADGALLASVRIDTRSCRESCADPRHLHRSTPLYVNLPRWVRGVEAARVVVMECRGKSAGRVLATMERSPSAPVVTSLAVEPATTGPVVFDPNSGRLTGEIRVAWTATDADGDALTADLLYSPDGGNAWIPLKVGDVGQSGGGEFVFDSAEVPASRGHNGKFRVDVSDGMNSSDHEGSQSFMLGNGAPPDVHVIGPNSNTTFKQGATVFLHGSAWDLDDQLLPEGSIEWTSSLDGALGTGRQLVVRDLSVGVHTITLRGTDSGGLFTEKTIVLTVTAREVNSGDFDGDGAIGAGDLALLLSEWGGPGLSDINLDGVADAADLAILLSRWG